MKFFKNIGLAVLAIAAAGALAACQSSGTVNYTHGHSDVLAGRVVTVSDYPDYGYPYYGGYPYYPYYGHSYYGYRHRHHGYFNRGYHQPYHGGYRGGQHSYGHGHR